jgi:class 3 adenylate cyclase
MHSWEGADREEVLYLVRRITGAKEIALPADEHEPMWPNNTEAAVRALRGFIDDVRDEEADLDRVLSTVMFTDIVDSTATAAVVGDRRWRELVEQHHGAVRALLGRFRGKEIDTAGDGFFATFDGPARGVRCAKAISGAVRHLGIEVRAGVHTGEVETMAGKVGGIAVVVGARIASLAGPSEVLISSTVRDLVSGSGLTFEDAGEHELKGVPDRWRLYRAVGERSSAVS